MLRPFKAAIMAALMTAVTIVTHPAQAEYRTLSEYGHWRVDINISEDGTLDCSVFNSWTDRNGYTHTAELGVWQDGNYYFLLLSDAWSPETNGATATIHLEFRSQSYAPEAWTLDNVFVNYHGNGDWGASLAIGPDPAQREFIQHFMAYEVMVIRTRSGRDIFGFSLSGSTSAIRDMNICRERIMRENPSSVIQGDPT